MSDNPTPTIVARMARHGFHPELHAWERDDGEVVERVYTDANGAVATTRPRHLTDRVFVVTGNRPEVDADDPLAEGVDLDGGYSLHQVLRALEDPRDDYYLLSLRLHNFVRRASHFD